MKRFLILMLSLCLLLCACSAPKPTEMIGEEKAVEIALQEALALKKEFPVSSDMAVCEIVMIFDEPYYEVCFEAFYPDTNEHWGSITVDIDAYTGEVYEVMPCC